MRVSCGSAISTLHDRVAPGRRSRLAAAHRAADGALEQAVGREAVGAVDEQREVVAAVAGRRERADLEVAGADDVAVGDVSVDAARTAAQRGGRATGDAEALRERVDVDDVVAVPCVTSTCVIVMSRSRRSASSSGSSTPFESTSTPCPPSPSATR